MQHRLKQYAFCPYFSRLIKFDGQRSTLVIQVINRINNTCNVRLNWFWSFSSILSRSFSVGYITLDSEDKPLKHNFSFNKLNDKYITVCNACRIVCDYQIKKNVSTKLALLNENLFSTLARVSHNSTTVACYCTTVPVNSTKVSGNYTKVAGCACHSSGVGGGALWLQCSWNAEWSRNITFMLHTNLVFFLQLFCAPR